MNPGTANFIRNDMSRLIFMDGTIEVETNWEETYGELPAGIYRIGKEVTDFRGTGDYDKEMLCAEFIFE